MNGKNSNDTTKNVKNSDDGGILKTTTNINVNINTYDNNIKDILNNLPHVSATVVNYNITIVKLQDTRHTQHAPCVTYLRNDNKNIRKTIIIIIIFKIHMEN